MSDLEDTFGSDFVQQFKQERQKRRAERQRVEKREMMQICAHAINENKMDGDNPMFTYTSETGVTHDVLLVNIPDPDNRSYWSLKTDGQEGSVSLPVEYLGQWIWAWFNDRDLAKKLEPGEWFIIVGRLDTWERDDGTEQDTLSPVRGLAHISEAKQWADKALEEDGFEVPEQPEDEDPAVLENSEADEENISSDEMEEIESAPEPEPEPEEDLLGEDTSSEAEDNIGEESDESGTFSQMLEEKRGGAEEEGEVEEEEQELVPYDDVKEQVEDIADAEPKVWDLSEEQPELLDKLVNMIGNRLEYETDDTGAIQNDDIASAIKEHVLQVIKEYNEEEEESSEEETLF